MEKEESRKIKTRWEEWGWGYVCGGEKTREKKKKKSKGKETYGMDARKEGNNNKKNKKSQLNVTTIFSQYFTINFKYRLLLVNIGE